MSRESASIGLRPGHRNRAAGSTGSFSRRRRAVWAAASVVLALGLLGAAAAWKSYHQPARIAAGLPAYPNLTGRPAELQQRMRRAWNASRQNGDRLAGVAELGRLCQANGFAAEAEACWRLLEAEQPRNARWAYYLAEQRRVAGDYPDMTKWLARTTEVAPDYAPAWLHLAEVQFKTGDFAAAAHNYEKRLSLIPGDPYARLGLARIALQQGQLQDARRQVEGLVRESPEFSPGHNLYAEMLAAAGDTANAAKERAAARERGRFREADDPWLDALAAWCFDYDQLCLRGAVDAQTKHGDWGKSSFERAVEIRPDVPDAYELLGSLYVELKCPAKARDVYEQGLRTAKTPPAAKYYVNLGRVYRLLNEPKETVRVAREGLARVGEDYELYDVLGVALRDMGEPAGAIDALQAAVASNPRDANANYDLAVSLLAGGRLEDAIKALHRSLALEPTFPSTLALLARIEIDSGRWRGAVQYLRPLYDAHPELEEARRQMAYCYLQAGAEAETRRDLDGAEQSFRAGLAIEPDDAELQARLGVLLLVQRRFGDAVLPLEAYHRLQSDNPQGALYLGQAYAALGRRREARTTLAEGAKLAERAGNAQTAQHCRDILARLP